MNRDKENPDIYIGLVVLKFKKGYPKIRKLEISEIQKRLARESQTRCDDFPKRNQSS